MPAVEGRARVVAATACIDALGVRSPEVETARRDEADDADDPEGAHAPLSLPSSATRIGLLRAKGTYGTSFSQPCTSGFNPR